MKIHKIYYGKNKFNNEPEVRIYSEDGEFIVSLPKVTFELLFTPVPLEPNERGIEDFDSTFAVYFYGEGVMDV